MWWAEDVELYPSKNLVRKRHSLGGFEGRYDPSEGGGEYPDPEDVMVATENDDANWETDESDVEILANYWPKKPPKTHRYYHQFHASDSGLEDDDMDGPDWGRRWEECLTQVKKEEPYRPPGERDILLEDFVQKKDQEIEFIARQNHDRREAARKKFRKWKRQFVRRSCNHETPVQVEEVEVEISEYEFEDEINQGDGDAVDEDKMHFLWKFKNPFVVLVHMVASFFHGVKVDPLVQHGKFGDTCQT